MNAPAEVEPMNRPPSFRFAALAAPVAALLWFGGAGPRATAQEPPPPPSSPATNDALAAAVSDFNSGEPERLARAVATLKAVSPASLPKAERGAWLRAARTAAVRAGDRAWLAALNAASQGTGDLPFEDAGTHLVQTARSYLEAGDLDRAKEFLDAFQRDYARFEERDRRRWLAISARRARLAGDTTSERKFITELVEYPGMWHLPNCRRCHDNPQQPGQLTRLDVRNWWPGLRYAALLKASGEAQAVADAMQAKLAKYPDDGAARLRLVYALKAVGKTREADDALSYFPWSVTPEPHGPAPVNVEAYP